jgi:hypothetical protein
MDPEDNETSEDKGKKDGAKGVLYSAIFILFVGAISVGGMMYYNYSIGRGLLGDGLLVDAPVAKK